MESKIYTGLDRMQLMHVCKQKCKHSTQLGFLVTQIAYQLRFATSMQFCEPFREEISTPANLLY